MPTPRTPTAVDRVADGYLGRLAAHDPLFATTSGISGHDARMPALDPEWFAERSSLRRDALAGLASAKPVDASDRVTVAALRDQLEIAEELHAAHEDEADLDNLASPLQAIREVFDVMPTDSVDDWEVIATRLVAVPDAVRGYTESLRAGARAGVVAALRQVDAGIEECAAYSGADGLFAGFAAGARAGDASLPESLRAHLADAARAAGEAYDGLGAFLRDELRAQAPERDAVGRELYALHSREFLGTRIDLEQTYEWGQAELAAITAEMRRTAGAIVPGASVEEAIAHLESDPARALQGVEALQEWLQTTSDEALAALAGTHFDIPEQIRSLECRIAPTQTGGIYYTAPSEDLVSRPGRMWWSVPPGRASFTTWQERTTVYHEGVPGHHLQFGYCMYRVDLLGRWRRLGAWLSGPGEGWALYAERLMAELGFLDDPADRLGQLDGQSLRAARVVVDLGVHCGFPAPASVGGGSWDWDKAWQFLGMHSRMSEGQRRFELTRYLGWPGQAPSYKIGEQRWLDLRAEAKAAAGASFELRDFHRRALEVGSVGLDVLRAAVLD